MGGCDTQHLLSIGSQVDVQSVLGRLDRWIHPKSPWAVHQPDWTAHWLGAYDSLICVASHSRLRSHKAGRGHLCIERFGKCQFHLLICYNINEPQMSKRFTICYVNNSLPKRNVYLRLQWKRRRLWKCGRHWQKSSRRRPLSCLVEMLMRRNGGKSGSKLQCHHRLMR